MCPIFEGFAGFLLNRVGIDLWLWLWLNHNNIIIVDIQEKGNQLKECLSDYKTEKRADDEINILVSYE